jgi:predicted DNA-binding transcriptional regulator AlpA
MKAQTTKTNSPLATLTVTDLAKILHVAPQTINNRMVRDPASLPPPLDIAGQQGRLWLESDVQEWLESKRKPS